MRFNSRREIRIARSLQYQPGNDTQITHAGIVGESAILLQFVSRRNLREQPAKRVATATVDACAKNCAASRCIFDFRI